MYHWRFTSFNRPLSYPFRSYLGLKNGGLSLVDCRICWVGLGGEGEGEGRTTGVDLGVLASGSCPHSTQIIYILGTLE